MLARALIVGGLVLAAAACDEASGMTDASVTVRPARPDACTPVLPGASVQAALDDPATAAVCLAPGEHAGPLRLTRAVTLWGSPGAVIRCATPGAIVEVLAPGAAVLGMTIDGTGGRFDHLDGAVRLAADDTRVEGVAVENAVFGILVERASRVRVIGNRIEGSRDPATGLRGDTIRLWETRDSVIADNTIEGGRDLVVWYSRGNAIRGNRVRGARYGLHFMYSHDNQVRGNELVGVVVGVFVMYSRGLEIADNLIANAAGAAGMAIGLKDAGNITVTGNRLIHDTLAIYLDSSPMQRGDRVEISRNVMRLNDTAVVFHASARDVRIHDNDLADNGTQVRVDGGGDATAVDWRGNYFDDYTGYDLDGDDVGDVPYELRSLSNQLTASHPGLALFRGTPALALVDAAAHLDPLYDPQPILIDPAPRLAPQWPAGRAEGARP
jgi:nitrous oxidase accessory protein